MIQVWYHANCNDGLAAAAVCYLKFGRNANYIPVEYYKPHPPVPSGDDIVIVDFSYSYETLVEIAASASKVTVLDHHASAQKDLEGKEWPANVNVQFDMHESGATLAWFYFFPESVPTPFLRMIKDRDLWLFKEADSKRLHAGLELEDRDVQTWASWAENPLPPRGIIDNGNLVLMVRAKQMQWISQHVRIARIAGYEVPILNSPILQSELGSLLVESYKEYPFAAVWFVDKDDMEVWSLRSLGFDVSVIAKKYGGGGHVRAAGFKVHDFEKVQLGECEAWRQVAIESNQRLDAQFKLFCPELEEHYGMPVDGFNKVVKKFQSKITTLAAVIKDSGRWTPELEALLVEAGLRSTDGAQ